MTSILTAFSSTSLSWVLHGYPTHVYARNLSCVQMTELMPCEEQQNGLGSSGGSRGVAGENEVDDTSTNNENDEIPLIIPTISPTLDGDGNDDADEGSGQQNSEDGDDGANSGEGNERPSNADHDNDDDLETALPSVLPFP